MSTQAERNCGRESNMGLGSPYRIGFLKRRIESELAWVWSSSDPSTAAKPVPCLCRPAPRSMVFVAVAKPVRPWKASEQPREEGRQPSPPVLPLSASLPLYRLRTSCTVEESDDQVRCCSCLCWPTVPFKFLVFDWILFLSRGMHLICVVSFLIKSLFDWGKTNKEVIFIAVRE